VARVSALAPDPTAVAFPFLLAFPLFVTCLLLLAFQLLMVYLLLLAYLLLLNYLLFLDSLILFNVVNVPSVSKFLLCWCSCCWCCSCSCWNKKINCLISNYLTTFGIICQLQDYRTTYYYCTIDLKNYRTADSENQDKLRTPSSIGSNRLEILYITVQIIG
jgi:hypothetical protein